jgi:hypothetical protein
MHRRSPADHPQMPRSARVDDVRHFAAFRRCGRPDLPAGRASLPAGDNDCRFRSSRIAGLVFPSLQRRGSNPYGDNEDFPRESLAPDLTENPQERLRSLLPYTGTSSSIPMEASMMFWSVLGAVILLVLAAAIYHHKRSNNHVRNSQHGQPMKNVEGATHPETVARNPNIMGGGDYFR